MTRAARPPTVVLVRPTEQGNVGAAARAMANMGLAELVLVEPAVELGATARAFAVGAAHILATVRRADSVDSALAPFERAVGTTSSRDRSLPGALIPPRELPAALAVDPPNTPTAIVFGPERSGLTTDELARLSPLVRIPASPVQPTLNLGQAVLIVCYELFLARHAQAAGEGSEQGPPAPLAEIEGLFDHLGRTLHEIGFARDDTAEATLRDLRRFFARAAPTSREVRIFRGICRRTLGSLERLSDGSER